MVSLASLGLLMSSRVETGPALRFSCAIYPAWRTPGYRPDHPFRVLSANYYCLKQQVTPPPLPNSSTCLAPSLPTRDPSFGRAMFPGLPWCTLVYLLLVPGPGHVSSPGHARKNYNSEFKGPADVSLDRLISFSY